MTTKIIVHQMDGVTTFKEVKETPKPKKSRKSRKLAKVIAVPQNVIENEV